MTGISTASQSMKAMFGNRWCFHWATQKQHRSGQEGRGVKELHCIFSEAEQLNLVSLTNGSPGFRCFPQIDDEETKICSAGHQRADAQKGPDVMRRRRTFIRRLRHDEHPKEALPQ